jgi:hypothetical protein
MVKKYSDRVYELFKSKINKIEKYSYEHSDKFLNIHEKYFPDSNNVDPKIYSLNNRGFRTKNFKKYNNNSTKILFAGCSNTYGEALPINLIWPTLLKNKMNSIYNDLDDYNVAYPAASIHSIIRNIIFFVKEFGKPDYLFIMFPGMNRDLFYSSKDNDFINGLIWNEYLFCDKTTQQKFNLSYIEENNILLSTTFLYMLEEFCKNSNIKLVWSTWREKDQNLFKDLNFENFILLNVESNKININELPHWDIAQDGHHPGTSWSTQVADAYFDWVINEKNKK